MKIDITQRQDARPRYMDSKTGEFSFGDPFPGVDELLKFYMSPTVAAIADRTEAELLAMYDGFVAASKRVPQK